jgi:hypothetical protein
MPNFVSVEDKIKKYVNKTNTCWIWVGCKDRHGYGKVSVQGKVVLAHRAIYEFFSNKIPTGKLLMHSCDNPACVNPEHLSIGTHQDNYDDMIRKGRKGKPKRIGRFRKEFCDYGHKRISYISNGRVRSRCQECIRISNNKIQNCEELRIKRNKKSMERYYKLKTRTKQLQEIV